MWLIETWLWLKPKIDNSKQGACQQGDTYQKNHFLTLAVRFRYFSSSPLHSHSSLLSFIINWIHIFKNPWLYAIIWLFSETSRMELIFNTFTLHMERSYLWASTTPVQTWCPPCAWRCISSTCAFAPWRQECPGQCWPHSSRWSLSRKTFQ